MENTIQCSDCGALMNLKSGVKKETGKPWKGWFCSNKMCKKVEWVHERNIDKTDEVFQGTRNMSTPPVKVHQTSTPAPKTTYQEPMSKEEWAAKDRQDYTSRCQAQLLSTFPQKERTLDELLELCDKVIVAVNSRLIINIYDYKKE